jgi:hypothetical protein
MYDLINEPSMAAAQCVSLNIYRYLKARNECEGPGRLHISGSTEVSQSMEGLGKKHSESVMLPLKVPWKAGSSSTSHTRGHPLTNSCGAISTFDRFVEEYDTGGCRTSTHSMLAETPSKEGNVD